MVLGAPLLPPSAVWRTDNLRTERVDEGPREPGGTLNSRLALLVGFLPQTSGHVLLLVAAVHLGLEHLVLLDVVVRPLVLGSGAGPCPPASPARDLSVLELVWQNEWWSPSSLSSETSRT